MDVSLHGGYLLLRTKQSLLKGHQLVGIQSRGRPALQHAEEVVIICAQCLLQYLALVEGHQQKVMVLLYSLGDFPTVCFCHFPHLPHLPPHCLPTLCPLSVCPLFIDSPLNSV